ncbi:hypothetical protein B0H13DRAFT_1853405 [Mycena leptocephala]|nr:hypothetical protein B0H13DRAFT_1853405 [Mycena leptocephala]
MHGKLLINELCLKAPDVRCVYGTYLVTGIDSSRLQVDTSRLGSTPKSVGVMHVTRFDSTQVDFAKSTWGAGVASRGNTTQESCAVPMATRLHGRGGGNHGIVHRKMVKKRSLLEQRAETLHVFEDDGNKSHATDGRKPYDSRCQGECFGGDMTQRGSAIKTQSFHMSEPDICEWHDDFGAKAEPETANEANKALRGPGSNRRIPKAIPSCIDVVKKMVLGGSREQTRYESTRLQVGGGRVKEIGDVVANLLNPQNSVSGRLFLHRASGWLVTGAKAGQTKGHHR